MRSPRGAGTCPRMRCAVSVAFSLMAPVPPANSLAMTAPFVCLDDPLSLLWENKANECGKFSVQCSENVVIPFTWYGLQSRSQFWLDSNSSPP